MQRAPSSPRTYYTYYSRCYGSLTCPKSQPKMSGKWRNPNHLSGRPSLITASSKNLVEAEWVWSTKPKTSSSTASLP